MRNLTFNTLWQFRGQTSIRNKTKKTFSLKRLLNHDWNEICLHIKWLDKHLKRLIKDFFLDDIKGLMSWRVMKSFFKKIENLYRLHRLTHKYIAPKKTCAVIFVWMKGYSRSWDHYQCFSEKMTDNNNLSE